MWQKSLTFSAEMINQVKGSHEGGFIMAKRLTTLTLIFVFLFSFLTTLQANWNEMQRSAAREGYIQERVVHPLDITFTYSANDEVTGSIIVVNDSVMYTTRNGWVGSFSLMNGKEYWKRRLDSAIYSSATSSDSELYVATKSGKVYSLSQANGAILWKTDVGVPVKAPLMRFFRYLYALGEDGSVYSLNSFDGKTIWKNEVNGTLLTAPCIKSNFIYFVSREGKLFCLDAYNGRFQWEFEMNYTSQSTPIPSTEIIVVGDDNGYVYGVDFIKGTSYFDKPLKGSITTPFSFGYFDRRMMVVGNGNTYAAFGSANGNIMWSQSVDNAIVPPLGTGDKIWFPGKNNKLVMVDSFSGKIGYEVSLSSQPSSAMAISNGRILVGTKGGEIYSLAPKENDFITRMKPEVGIVVPGGTLVYDIEINAKEDFNDIVRLSITGFPCSCHAVRRRIEPAMIEGKGTAQLIIEAPEDTQPEEFRVTIHAISQSGKTRKTSSVLAIQPTKERNQFIFATEDQVEAGKDFEIDVLIHHAVNVRSAQTLIQFCTDTMFFHRADPGDFFGEMEENFFFDHYVDQDKGKLMISMTRNDISSSGEGSIARLYFRARKPGNITLDFIQPSVRDSFLREIGWSADPFEIEIIPGDQKIIELMIGQPYIHIDGSRYELDAPPVIQQGRTLVPVRRIAEELEATVSWDASEEKVTLERFDKIIELWIGNPICRINGVEQNLPSDVPPVIMKNRTFLPLRFVAESLDSQVEWFSDTQKIRIIYPSYE